MSQSSAIPALQCELLSPKGIQEWEEYLLSVCISVAKSCPTLFEPMDCRLTGSSVHGISTQEYRNGLPFPSPTCYLIASRLQPIPMVSPKGAQNVKNIGYWPQDNWDAYERNDFSKLRLWLLPLHRKVLNSLTWDIWFSLINNNLLMLRLPALCRKTSI